MKEYKILGLGGSLLFLNGEFDIEFLKKFRRFILREIKKGKKFVIVVGGGFTARFYQMSASKITKVVDEDKDWLGIHATRLNAHLLRTIFREIAYPVIIEDIRKKIKGKPRLIFGAGTRPGWSTDYVCALLAKKFKAKEIISLTNIPYVYDKDPQKFKDAKPFKKISFKEYKKLIPSQWEPGLSLPFDPVATRLAEKLGLVVKVVFGKNLKEVKKAIEGKKFEGSIIYS